MRFLLDIITRESIDGYYIVCCQAYNLCIGRTVPLRISETGDEVHTRLILSHQELFRQIFLNSSKEYMLAFFIQCTHTTDVTGEVFLNDKIGQHHLLMDWCVAV